MIGALGVIGVVLFAIVFVVLGAMIWLANAIGDCLTFLCQWIWWIWMSLTEKPEQRYRRLRPWYRG